MRAWLCILFACMTACGSSTPAAPPVLGDGGAGPAADGGALPDGGGPDGGAAQPDAGLVCPASVTAVVVSPAMATLTINGGTIVPQQFTAEADLGDGGRTALAVVW